MKLKQLVEAAGGELGLAKIVEFADLTAGDVDLVCTTFSPLLIAQFNQLVDQRIGRNWLRRQQASGGPQQFIDRPSLMIASLADIEGQKWLLLLFGGKSGVDELLSGLFESTQIRVRDLQVILPRLVCLFIGAVCKQLKI